MKETETSFFARAQNFLRRDLWSREALTSRPLEWARHLLQLIVMIGEGFLRDQLILRANALTYLTMLSVIPLLAIAVAVASALGLNGASLLEMVKEGLAVSIPPDVEADIVSGIENVNFSGLGGLGAGVFLLTTVLAIGSVEKAFNQIWRVKEQRPWIRRIPDYLAVLLIGPLVMGFSGTLTATLRSQWAMQRLLEVPFFASLYETGLRFTPYLLLFVGFAFFYWFLPNTKVRLLSALIGGLVAAIFFTWAQSIYVNLNVGVAKYSAFFGGFAFLPLLMVWIYISWIISLLGAEVAFAHQNLRFYSRELRSPSLGAADREAVGLAIALEIARSFRDENDAWNDRDLAEAIDMPILTIRDLLGDLESTGILSRVAGDDPLARYQLGRPAEHITVAQVLACLRGQRHDRLRDNAVIKAVNSCLDRLDRDAIETVAGRTLRDLLEDVPVSPATPPASP